MLFNSLEFVIFLPVVFGLYWFIFNRNLKIQNIFLLAASYVFYGFWNWKFLFLLLFLAVSTYLIAIRINHSKDTGRRRLWLYTGLFISIGTLVIFKYNNFFINSLIDLISLTGYVPARASLKIILPIGISFYTFLSLSYIIDVYKENLTAGKNIVEVLLSLNFFPIILAGPIQRPALLLPQIREKRELGEERFSDGLRQILWGMFTKIVIADNLAQSVDPVFNDFAGNSGSTLLVTIFLYAIQIYADFSGYSNMAIGTAKLLGFSLIRNFNYPYFSRDITEFWKRWHISLTTWFRDYIFLPLSFKLSGLFRRDRYFFIRADQLVYIGASLVTWLLTGLWHGSNYTFLAWGLLNGLFLILYHLQVKPRKKLFRKIGIQNDHPIVVTIETVVTFFMILVAWIFFRSENIGDAFLYLNRICSASLLSMPEITSKKAIILAIVFLIVEWVQKKHEYALELHEIKWRILRWGVYIAVIELILILGNANHKFIYFQF